MESRSSTVNANLVAYELHSLGWKAFQDLCATIMGEVLGQTVQVFLSSRDAGRDGAFQGSWKPAAGEEFAGPFTVQCKFTSKRDRMLSLSDVQSELTKAATLASKGLAKNYIVMTNNGVSGVVDEELRRAFLAIPGIERFAAYGHDWITLKIRESSRLRLLVPRVYGLGDLSQILDERAYAQAQDILFSMGEDLAKFVVTDAYRKAATALVRHGFVILLGEPASGKSTIAAHLSLGAIDNWGCSTLKVRSADEFADRWNPHEPRQFFWIDDVFGPTQYLRHRVDEWNQVFPHLIAAIRHGAKILFTSRDYIFRAASVDIKKGAFPLIGSSQVIINVHALSTTEKEHILYNHIKLGNQPSDLRRQMRPFLSDVAANPKFLPEIARRLGDQLFTKKLLTMFGHQLITKEALRRFVEQPLEFLIEVLESLDRDAFGAIALIFMRGGTLESPILITPRDENAISLLGASPGGLRSAFKALQGSLVKRTKSEGLFSWTYQHPTLGDALGFIVAADPELLDIYIEGTPVEKLVREVVCGDIEIQGVQVIIPPNRFASFIERLTGLQISQLYSFLAFRTDKRFLSTFIAQNPDIFSELTSGSSYLASNSAYLLAKLNEFRLLPETWRIKFVETVARVAINTPDADFLSSSEIRSLFSEAEIGEILRKIELELLPTLSDLVEDSETNYDGSEDPDEYFSPLSEALMTFRDEYPEESDARLEINKALVKIERAIQYIRDEAPEEERDRESDYESYGSRQPSFGGERSIFDDVDQ